MVKNVFYFPLLVLQGTYHYWKYSYFSRGLKQMEVCVLRLARSWCWCPFHFLLISLPLPTQRGCIIFKDSNIMSHFPWLLSYSRSPEPNPPGLCRPLPRTEALLVTRSRPHGDLTQICPPSQKLDTSFGRELVLHFEPRSQEPVFNPSEASYTCWISVRVHTIYKYSPKNHDKSKDPRLRWQSQQVAS